MMSGSVSRLDPHSGICTSGATDEVTIPDSVAATFQAFYDRAIERQEQRKGPAGPDFFGTMTPILLLYLIPSELDGSKLIARQNPFSFGTFDPGKTTITVDHVPPGTYVARCAGSQAEVTLLAGEKVSVTLVSEGISNE